eukprot:9967833-Alexandrium_andersonii.AAC.1
MCIRDSAKGDPSGEPVAKLNSALDKVVVLLDGLAKPSVANASAASASGDGSRRDAGDGADPVQDDKREL